MAHRPDAPSPPTPDPPPPLLDRWFDFTGRGAGWRGEILGGLTTFLTMAYIVVVNPRILADGGVPHGGAVFATCVAAALATLLMGLWANYPIALAPGMGLNAYFAYAAVPAIVALGTSREDAWRGALAAVFCAGAVFLLLSIFRVREALIRAIPRDLQLAIAGGIGLFIAFIGLQHGGIIVADPVTLVGLGSLAGPGPAVTLGGVILIAVLLARRVPGAMLIGIGGGAVVGWLAGLTEWPETLAAWPAAGATLGRLDLGTLWQAGMAGIVLAFLFVDLFDTVGTLIAVGHQGRFVDEAGELPRAGRAFQADALGTVAGAVCGTSPVTSYIESAAGVAAGARTGLANCVTAAGFLLVLPFTPVIAAVPAAATAPALIIVGSLMLAGLTRVHWTDPTLAVPAFLTLVGIPLTFSISDGIAFGLLAYAVINLLAGQPRRVHPLLWVLAGIFLLHYLW